MTIGAPTHGESLGGGLPFSPATDASPWHGPVDLHPAIREVQRMKEFQPPRPGWLADLLKQPWMKGLKAWGEKVQHTLDGILHELGRFLSHMRPSGLAHLPENIRDLFSGFVGFLLVLLGLYAFYILLGWLLRLREEKAAQLAPTARIVDESLLVSSGYHAGQARLLAEDGHLDAALRQLYLALLCLLDESKLVPFEFARTNREYADSLPDDPNGLRPGFLQIARAFEAVRYGRATLNRSQFETCETLYLSLQESARRHAPPA